MLWMTTLLGMLIMGAAKFTSSDHEPEEPQTVDHSDPAQFYSVRIEPVQSKPQSENPTDPLRGSAADDNLIDHAGPNRINGYGGNGGNGGNDTIAGRSGQAGNGSLLGYHDDDKLRGGAGRDTLISGMGHDFLDGIEHHATDTEDPQDVGNQVHDERDYLNGGDGDDTLIAGASDVVTPGIGQDTIILDAANAGKTPTSIIAFGSQHDSIIIAYGEAAQTLHEVHLQRHQTDPALTQIVLDGAVIATLNTVTGFTASDIALVAGTQT